MPCTVRTPVPPRTAVGTPLVAAQPAVGHCRKMAVVLWLADIGSLHVALVPRQAPVQWSNVMKFGSSLNALSTAVSVSPMPYVQVASQSPLSDGESTCTTPAPMPWTVRVSVRLWFISRKYPVTEAPAWVMVRSHVSQVKSVQSPPNCSHWEPAPGTAAR